MYEPESILELKDPKFIDPDGRPRPMSEFKPKNKDDEPTPFPYNRVKVIGQSPLVHTGARGDWEGAAAQGVIIQPLSDFAANLDEPLGKVQRLYNTVSIPETVIPANPVRVVHSTSGSAGPTPEEQFAAATDPNAKKSTERVKTPLTLDDVDDDKPSSSPLGD